MQWTVRSLRLHITPTAIRMFGDYENEFINIHLIMNEATHIQDLYNRQIAYEPMLAVVNY